jgi:hypothetical protein
MQRLIRDVSLYKPSIGNRYVNSVWTPSHVDPCGTQVDRRISSLQMRLKHPTWDRRKAVLTPPYEYEVTSPAAFGLPASSQLRMYASTTLGLQATNGAPKKPSLAQFLDGLVAEAAHHRPDFIFTDMPDLHQCIESGASESKVRVAIGGEIIFMRPCIFHS